MKIKILFCLLMCWTKSEAFLSTDGVEKVTIYMIVIGRNFDEDGRKKSDSLPSNADGGGIVPKASWLQIITSVNDAKSKGRLVEFDGYPDKIKDLQNKDSMAADYIGHIVISYNDGSTITLNFDCFDSIKITKDENGVETSTGYLWFEGEKKMQEILTEWRLREIKEMREFLDKK